MSSQWDLKPLDSVSQGLSRRRQLCHLRIGRLFLQLWHGAAKKVSPSFVMAISVSGECDIRGRQVRKSYESDL